MSTHLTQGFAKSVQSNKPTIFFDDQIGGFGLRVYPNGSKSFTFQHTPFGRRVIGKFPAISATAARKVAADWKLQFNAGKNPFAEKAEARVRADKIKAKSKINVAAAFKDFEESHLAQVGKRHADDCRSVMKVHVLPVIGHMYPQDVTTRTIIKLISPLIRPKTGKPKAPTARHVCSHLSKMWNWMLIDADYMDHCGPNPIVKGLAPPPAAPREDKLNLSDYKAVYDAADQLPNPYATACVRALMLTAHRKNEVAGMRWDELDLQKRLWTLPKQRTKAGIEDIVPLTNTVIALINSLPRQSGDYVFSTTTGTRPIQLGSQLKERLIKAAGITQDDDGNPLTFHGFRRTIATTLQNADQPPWVIKILEGRKVQGIEEHYQQGQMLDIKRRALEKFERLLFGQTSKVINIR